MWTIVFMIIVGALIGGLTNLLAIRMLFRPYKQIKVSSFKIPFTPGLIPKRHQEIAKQLGDTVVKYLLTSDGLGEQVKSEAFINDFTSWLQIEAKKALESEETVAIFLENKWKINEPKKQLQLKIEQHLGAEYEAFFDRNKETPISTLMPINLSEKVQQSIPTMAEWIQNNFDQKLQSPDGKEQLNAMVERYLLKKGTLGNMLKMFLGNDRLVDKLQPQISKLLRDEQTKELIESVLRKEWYQIQNKSIEELKGMVTKEQFLTHISPFVQEKIPVVNWLDKPISEISKPYQEQIMNRMIPSIVEFSIDVLVERLPFILGRLQLEEIVRKQVEGFPLERLEEIVVSIAKRELKMITWLGSFLGGFIGLFQGLIVLFLV
ncbi:DUF445 domain-containing protein [Alkalihalobacillus sp. 1P02AB]|uniref:DUF445 domain-containing protein n=1 Tax=Alkalihalobacillus sp. 1P02AB TaxID=3132260 RepID=UPI0039A77086